MSKLTEDEIKFLKKYSGIVTESVSEVRGIALQLQDVKKELLRRLELGYIKNEEAKRLLTGIEDQLDKMIYSLNQYEDRNVSRDSL